MKTILQAFRFYLEAIPDARIAQSLHLDAVNSRDVSLVDIYFPGSASCEEANPSRAENYSAFEERLLITRLLIRRAFRYYKLSGAPRCEFIVTPGGNGYRANPGLVFRFFIDKSTVPFPVGLEE